MKFVCNKCNGAIGGDIRHGFSVGDFVLIKDGAKSFQDMQFFDWKNGIYPIVFKINAFSDKEAISYAICEAPGYGEKNNYGNGHVYARCDGIIKVDI